MMMELMGESLTHYVKKPNINMKMKASILNDVAFGLHYLHNHEPPVVHRDLSPNNIPGYYHVKVHLQKSVTWEWPKQ